MLRVGIRRSCRNRAFVVAAKIDAVADLGREVAALAQLREHHADHRAGDLFPCIGRNAVGRGRGDDLRAGRDRPARVDLVNEPALGEHVAEAGDHLSAGILWRHRICPDDGVSDPESQFPLRRDLERGLDPCEQLISVDLLCRALGRARPRRRCEAIEQFDLSQRARRIIAAVVRQIGVA